METIAWIEKYLSQAEQLIYDGQLDEGLNILHELLFEEPGYGSLHNFLGWAYMYHVKDGARAELHFKVAIRFAPDYAPPFLHIGNLLNNSGRYAEAIEYFRLGLTKPDALRSILFEGIAQAYELQGDFRQAIRAYKDAAKASVAEFEVERLLNGVKRCRKKRVVLFFTF